MNNKPAVSAIEVRLVCSTEKCENIKKLTMPEVRIENDIMKVEAANYYVCRKCGALMDVKVFRVTRGSGKAEGKVFTTELTVLE